MMYLKTPEASTSDESRFICAKSSSRAVVLNKNEEKYYAGISTELVLYEDPWKIKKELTVSDLGHLSRLLLPGKCVETHVLQWMGKDMVGRVESTDGMEVAVWDKDAGLEHRLVFRRWPSTGSYVLNGGWNKLFVKGRGLKVGDEIGIEGNKFLNIIRKLRKNVPILHLNHRSFEVYYVNEHTSFATD